MTSWVKEKVESCKRHLHRQPKEGDPKKAAKKKIPKDALLDMRIMTYSAHDKNNEANKNLLDIYCLCIWGDNSTFAVGGRDHFVRVWNRSGKQRHIMTGHYESVRGVSVTPEGTALWTVAEDKSVRTWDLATGKLLTTAFHKEKKEKLLCVATWGDGACAVSGSAEGSIQRWGDSPDSEQAMWAAHETAITGICTSEDGSLIVSASEDIRTWTATGELLRKIEVPNIVDPEEDPETPEESPDAPAAEAAEGEEPAPPPPPEPPGPLVRGLATWGAGAKVAAACRDRRVRLYDTATGELLHTLEGHTDVVTSVAVSPTGTVLVSGSRDHTVRLWDLTTEGELIRVLEGHEAAVNAVAISADERFVLSGAADGAAKVWDRQPNAGADEKKDAKAKKEKAK